MGRERDLQGHAICIPQPRIMPKQIKKNLYQNHEINLCLKSTVTFQILGFLKMDGKIVWYNKTNILTKIIMANSYHNLET